MRTIDADAMKAEVKSLDAESNNNTYKSAMVDMLRFFIEFIDNQPTIEAKPVRHGRWIPIEYDSYADGNPVWDKFECSECGHEHSGEEDTLTAFCPDCGSEMMDENTNNVKVKPLLHGRWIQRRNGKYYCSNCGREEKHIFQKNYCPRCGVKIDLRTPTQAQLDEVDSVIMGDDENEI